MLGITNYLKQQSGKTIDVLETSAEDIIEIIGAKGFFVSKNMDDKEHLYLCVLRKGNKEYFVSHR